MSDTFEVIDRLEPAIQFLPAGDTFELQFLPAAGPIEARVGWVRDVDPPAHEPEVGDPFPFNVTFDIRLLRPGSNSPVELQVSGNPLRDRLDPPTYSVPAAQAGRSFRCQFTNTSLFTLRFRPSVQFVSEVLPLQRTAIPLRLLNHGLSQLVRALDLRIHLDGERSFVDFSDEFKRLTKSPSAHRTLPYRSPRT